MPYPHQTMIVRTEVFHQIGAFKLDYKRTMDFEFTCRLQKANKKGFYFPLSTMLMDGKGISSSQEYQTLLESVKALKENGLYHFSNRYDFIIRMLGFLFRKALIQLKLNSLLALLKKLKHRETT